MGFNVDLVSDRRSKAASDSLDVAMQMDISAAFTLGDDHADTGVYPVIGCDDHTKLTGIDIFLGKLHRDLSIGAGLDSAEPHLGLQTLHDARRLALAGRGSVEKQTLNNVVLERVVLLGEVSLLLRAQVVIRVVVMRVDLEEDDILLLHLEGLRLLAGMDLFNFCHGRFLLNVYVYY